MAIEQIKVGFDNFSYIIYCNITNFAAVVDPGYDSIKLLDIIKSKNLELKYIILTHYHNDHTSECLKIKNKMPNAKIISSKIEKDNIRFPVDITILNNENIQLGKINLKFLLTPGHTKGSVCILVDDVAIITGDTLFIGDCGRIDLPGGDLNQMYHSLHKKIMSLSDDLIVYPGHDYGDKPYDLLGNQKKHFTSYFKDVMHLIQK